MVKFEPLNQTGLCPVNRFHLSNVLSTLFCLKTVSGYAASTTCIVTQWNKDVMTEVFRLLFWASIPGNLGSYVRSMQFETLSQPIFIFFPLTHSTGLFSILWSLCWGPNSSVANSAEFVSSGGAFVSHSEPCKLGILLTLRICAWPVLGLLRAQQQAFPLTVWWTPKSLLPLDLNPETVKTQRKGQPRLCGGWGSGRFVTLEGVLIWKLPLALIQSQ